MEKYEYLFRRKVDGNCKFKPLNPPPFSLPRVRNSSITSKTRTENNSASQIVTPNINTDIRSLNKQGRSLKQDTHDAAKLLASMKNLIKKELHICPPKELLPSIPDLEKYFKRRETAEVESCGINIEMKPVVTSHSSVLDDFPRNFFGNPRARAVSMDSHLSEAAKRCYSIDESISSHSTVSSDKEEVPARISPPTSPLLHSSHLIEPCPLARKSSRRGADRRKRYLDDHVLSSDEEKEVSIAKSRPTKKVKASKNSLPSKNTSKEVKKKEKNTKAILRKKFSWKNYPELEEFLIANREEYLRHSALNYTMQQKQYNNSLTERLIDLASTCGYEFDEEVFTFVTIRDRIRCYFKSYVQSRKKRGVIIGYAARKAGLLSEKELERSAGIKGKIVSAGDSKRRK